MVKFRLVLFVPLLCFLLSFGCNKKPDSENKDVKQNTSDKKEPGKFEWKDGVSVSDIPDSPLKGSLNGKEVTFLYINFEKWHGPNDNVINFSLVKPLQQCGFIDGFTGFQLMNKGNAFSQGDWVKSKFEDDPKTCQAFFKTEGSDKSTSQWNCVLSIESMTDKTVKGKIVLFFNDDKKSWVAGKFEAPICNN